MDNLTHSLIGALLGQAGLKRKTGLAMPALIIGANIPDVDATCTIYGIESLAMRRGLTHGPIAWVVLPLILAGLLWWYDRWQAKRGKRPEKRLAVHFGWLWALSFIACLTHPAMDWLNTYGIRLLEPFSHRWFYGDALFIVDVWLWLGMGFATWFSLRREKRGRPWRWPAAAALAGAGIYILVNGAISVGSGLLFGINNKAPGKYISADTVITSPVPFIPWRRELIVGRRNDWYVGSSDEFEGYKPPRPIAPHICTWPDTDELTRSRPDLKAFLFWSRAPFVTPSEDGKGIVFNDARFYNGFTRGRFAVEVRGVPCK
ncbi:MAG TPA: metal-dependent hydrolase [Sphingomonadaceae bacterium]|nr:metal-dependent hydrolase [Sphingomonadaceae bacterium]